MIFLDPLQPGQDPGPRNSLRSLSSVSVVVEQLSDPGQQDGLRKESIRTDVELRLRKAGIRVVSDDRTNFSYLYVNINAVRSKEIPVYAVAIEISFHQLVALERNKAIILFAPTWHKQSVVIVGANKIADIRQEMGDNLDEFINDFLAMNPK
jgi:hypothetical protein